MSGPTGWQAALLAGGRGTRLWPLTAAVPKPLVEVAGRPILAHQLAHLAACGVQRVAVLVADDHREVFERAVAEVQARPPAPAGVDVQVRVVGEPQPLGSAGAVGAAVAAGALGARAPTLWANADVVAAPDLARLERTRAERGALAALRVGPVADPRAFGIAEVGADGSVERFVEKPDPSATASRLANAGVCALAGEVVAGLPADRPASLEREVLPDLLGRPGGVVAVDDGRRWVDAGTPERLLVAEAEVLGGRVGWTPSGRRCAWGWRADDAEVAGEVVGPALVGRGATVAAGGRLHGPVSLGAEARVGERARVAGSWLGRDVVVGAGAQVERSVLGPGTVVGPGARLERVTAGPAGRVAPGARLVATVVAPGARAGGAYGRGDDAANFSTAW